MTNVAAGARIREPSSSNVYVAEERPSFGSMIFCDVVQSVHRDKSFRLSRTAAQDDPTEVDGLSHCSD